MKNICHIVIVIAATIITLAGVSFYVHIFHKYWKSNWRMNGCMFIPTETTWVQEPGYNAIYGIAYYPHTWYFGEYLSGIISADSLTELKHLISAKNFAKKNQGYTSFSIGLNY